MDLHFVSEPMDFNCKIGSNVDLGKTFDLSGNDNDEMLKLYLRKAGLSDNIEYLTAEQRRAFIFDIVKSNKNPGYWKPSVLPQTPTSSQAPFRKTSIERESSTSSLASITDILPASLTFDLSTYRKAKTANSRVEQKSKNSSTHFERQFSSNKSVLKPAKSMPSISIPSTSHKTRKGRIVTVGGPTNFRHISGDMTRDMTKNTFDLSGDFNNNSLRKYLIERGIKEEDVNWLDPKDLIKKIVQSNYTWVPPRKQFVEHVIPPPPSEKCMATELPPPSPPRHNNFSKGGAIIISPPVLPDENIYEQIKEPKPNITSITQPKREQRPRPPPPPTKESTDKSSLSYVFKSMEETKICQNQTTTSPHPPPPPPLPPMPITQEDRKTINPIDNAKKSKTSLQSKIIKDTLSNEKVQPPPPPPPPPMPIEQTLTTGNYPPPPPAPPMPDFLKSTEKSTPKPILHSTESKPTPKQTGSDNVRDALMESIRNGTTLKKIGNPDKQLKDNIKTSNTASQQDTAQSATVVQVPQKPDFMSELRNATLKRIKKLENNPYNSESEC